MLTNKNNVGRSVEKQQQQQVNESMVLPINDSKNENQFDERE